MTELLSEITFCDECPYSGEPNGCNRKEGVCKAHESYFDLVEENADLRERLKRAVEFPIKCGDYVYDILDGTAYKTEVIELRVNIHGDLWCRTVSSYFPLELLGKRIFLTKEAAEARLAELKGEVNEI